MPEWVSEGSVRKYNRAVAQLSKPTIVNNVVTPAPEYTEDDVKALYIKFGGLVLGDASTVRGVGEGDETAAVARAEEADQAAVEAGKIKRTRKKK